MPGAIVVAVVALGFVIGALRRRYNFGSRQEVLRLFNGLSQDFNDGGYCDIRQAGRESPFKGLRLAR